MAKRLRKPEKKPEVLFEGDYIEYKLTLHIQADSDIEVWAGYGVTSQVQPGETGSEADRRIRKHVEREVEERLNAAVYDD